MKKILVFLSLFVFTTTRATDFKKMHESFDDALVLNIDSALHIAENMLKLAEKEQSYEWQARALDDQAEAFLYSGKVLQAVERLNRSLKMAELSHKPEVIARALVSLGNAHTQTGNYDNALAYYKRALAHAEKMGDKNKIMVIYANMGNVYEVTNAYEKAGEYYEKAYVLINEIKNEPLFPRMEINLAINQENRGNHPIALQWAEKALASSRKINDRGSEAEACGVMGKIYRAGKQYPKAEKSLKEAMFLSEKIGNQMQVCEDHLELADLYLERKSNTAALQQVQQAIQLARELGAVERLARAYTIGAKIYTQMGKADNALEFQKMAEVIQDSLQQEELNRQAAQHQIEMEQRKLELLQKEQQLKENELKLKREKRLLEEKRESGGQSMLYFAGALALVLVIVIVLILNNNRKKKVY